MVIADRQELVERDHELAARLRQPLQRVHAQAEEMVGINQVHLLALQNGIELPPHVRRGELIEMLVPCGIDENRKLARRAQPQPLAVRLGAYGNEDGGLTEIA